MIEEAEETVGAEEEKEILKLALERFQRGIEACSENQKAWLEDVRFALGEQWPEKIKNQRETDNRPCVTINRTQQMVKQVVNDMRQNRAAIKVHPTGEGSREDTAEILTGLIRQIESSSCAADHYISAADGAVTGGFGYFRILPEYESDGFDQCLKIKRIRNPLTVVLDPDAQQPDRSDCKWGFIIDDIPRKEFELKYPKVPASDFKGEVSASQGWITQETVRIAEYYEIVETEDTLYQLVDGTLIKRSEMPAEPPKEMVTQKRAIFTKQCVWRKLTAVNVFDTRTYPTSYVPVIEVTGEEYDIEGKVIKMGIVRHAKDPARVYNYARTAATEQVALAPKAPYIIAEGQVEGYEDLWNQANVKNYAYLPYKPQTIGGQHVPAPQRVQFSGVPAGSMADLQLASEEIKAVTGIYDAALGASGNETSGKAIMARQREADNATYHYVDNLNRAIRLCGRQLVELIPLIYDTARTIRILGEDGAEKLVQINQQNPMEGGRINDLTVGKYDVVIQAGPSYETKRIEAVNSMTAFVQAAPETAPMIADLIAKSMDWPLKDKIAERLHAMLPPAILAAEQAKEEGQELPPQVAAHLEEMAQGIQQLQTVAEEQAAEIERLQLELKDKAGELEVKRFEAQTKRLQVEQKQAGEAEANLDGEAATIVDAVMAAIGETPAAEAAEPQMGLEQILKAVASMQQPINITVPVTVDGKGAMTKQGRAVKQADGSYTMESVETPVGVE